MRGMGETRTEESLDRIARALERIADELERERTLERLRAMDAEDGGQRWKPSTSPSERCSEGSSARSWPTWSRT